MTEEMKQGREARALKASARIVDELVGRHPHLREAREALRSNEAHYAEEALASFRVRFHGNTER